jgi:hypothetical protein
MQTIAQLLVLILVLVHQGYPLLAICFQRFLFILQQFNLLLQVLSCYLIALSYVYFHVARVVLITFNLFWCELIELTLNHVQNLRKRFFFSLFAADYSLDVLQKPQVVFLFDFQCFQLALVVFLFVQQSLVVLVL